MSEARYFLAMNKKRAMRQYVRTRTFGRTIGCRSDMSAWYSRLHRFQQTTSTRALAPIVMWPVPVSVRDSLCGVGFLLFCQQERCYRRLGSHAHSTKPRRQANSAMPVRYVIGDRRTLAAQKDRAKQQSFARPLRFTSVAVTKVT